MNTHKMAVEFDVSLNESRYLGLQSDALPISCLSRIGPTIAAL